MSENVSGAGSVGPYHWASKPGYSGGFIVWRDGSTRTVTYGNYTDESIKSSLQEDWDEEKEVEGARAAGGGERLCSLGWHIHEDGTFFKWMGSGRPGVRLNYFIGRSPIQWLAGKIAGIGPNAVPFMCAECRRPVPSEEELSEAQARKWNIADG